MKLPNSFSEKHGGLHRTFLAYEKRVTPNVMTNTFDKHYINIFPLWKTFPDCAGSLCVLIVLLSMFDCLTH